MHFFEANASWVGFLGVALLASACGGGSRHAVSPHGETTTTAATLAGGEGIAKLLVAEPHRVSLAVRDGCISTMRSAAAAGEGAELRVRCPREERVAAFLQGAEATLARLTVSPAAPLGDRRDRASREDDDADDAQPWAKILLRSGKVVKVEKPAEALELAAGLRAFETELAAAEQPLPGPKSPAGWQLLHVGGPAHVVFAGTPAHGVLEAKVSTSGQYLCEFVTGGRGGAMRATKSGFLPAASAAHAIDEVLLPFNATEAPGAGQGTFAAGVQDGRERQGNPASTGAVFERFAGVQEALGDACLPELEGPSAASIGL